MGRGQSIVLHLHRAGRERALLKWHREEVGWRDWTPHGRDRHAGGVEPGNKKFFLTVLGQA